MRIQKILGAVMVACGMAALILLGDLTIGSICLIIGLALVASRQKVLS